MASTNALAANAFPIPARAWVARLSLSGIVLLGGPTSPIPPRSPTVAFAHRGPLI